VDGLDGAELRDGAPDTAVNEADAGAGGPDAGTAGQTPVQSGQTPLRASRAPVQAPRQVGRERLSVVRLHPQVLHISRPPG
jgi:hypothetical protein